jgi:CBS domain-containing protein
MKPDPITVTPDTDITQATKLLLENRVNGLPVLDAENKLVGILCQSDLIAQQKKIPLPSFFTFLDGFIPLTSVKQIEKELRKVAAITVEEAMTPNPVFVSPDTEVRSIAQLMVDRNYHTLPVLENGRLVGIVGKEDVLRTLVKTPPETD